MLNILFLCQATLCVRLSIKMQMQTKPENSTNTKQSTWDSLCQIRTHKQISKLRSLIRTATADMEIKAIGHPFWHAVSTIFQKPSLISKFITKFTHFSRSIMCWPTMKRKSLKFNLTNKFSGCCVFKLRHIRTILVSFVGNPSVMAVCWSLMMNHSRILWKEIR